MAYIGRDISNLSDRAVLDNITTSATATYNLLLNGVAFVPSSAESLTVSLNGVIQRPQSSYTVNNATIVFDSALTSSDSIDFIIAERAITLTTVGTGTITPDKLASSVKSAVIWQSSVKTSSFTASSNEGYWVDTSSNTVTITFPSSPSVGDTIELVDYARNWGTNKIIIDSNGLNYQGQADTYAVEYSTNGQALRVVYSGATKGWIPTSDDDVANVPIPPDFNVDFLVVAGGGAGGHQHGGGGGAGGYRTSTQSTGSGVAITVTVGAGGGAVAYGNQGNDGSNSSFSGSGFTTITSTGGGGGSYYDGGNGRTGGSGGGGGSDSISNAGLGTSGQGNNGGNGSGHSASQYGAGGGGGAGAVGANGTSAGGGNGGAGSASSITGSSTTYAGGGGGSAFTGNAGSGGSGGGGAGGTNSVNSGNGTANLGGGGGGTGSGGGAGGSGAVILSVPTSRYSGTTTGSPTVTTSGSNTIIKFTGSGSYTT